MEGSQMTGINLRVATLKNAKLKNCNLRGATLAGTDLENCDLSGCDLQEANLRGSNVKGAIFEEMLTPLHIARLTRMADKSSLLWLGLVVVLVCQGCCQHWSYGLRPGGKRGANSLQDVLQDIAEELQKLDSSSLPGCNDLSPHISLSSLKEILANLADRETGRKNI
ncbi:hypothetical protein AAFF_G00389150 [Aldrovandia affinis]|uniref:Progonadoliberin n=1 Tax=Aldrovandia affinis TaxID=143900 RepID=A0AAD7SEE1_9TELE|nr:hypothetical protein AAFF_G00389150 [Aldrovandia affinis]